MVVKQLIFDGFAMGLVYVLLATGNVIICSVNKIIFIAYAAFYTIGSYFVWTLVTNSGIPYFIALIGSSLACGLLAVIVYLLVFKKHQLQITSGGFLATMLASMGLNMVLNQLVLLFFGTTSKNVPSVFQGSFSFAGIHIAKDKVMLIVVGIVVCLALFYIYERTKIGRCMRAVSVDPEVATMYGIKANSVYMLSLGLACTVAGLAGGILAPSYGISPSMGNNIYWTVSLMTMFGGCNSLPGAVVGGIVVGQILSFGQYLIGSYVQIVLFLVIFVVLYFRPYGLMGTRIDVGIGN